MIFTRLKPIDCLPIGVLKKVQSIIWSEHYMVAEFRIFVEKTTEHLTESLVTRLASFTLFFSFLFLLVVISTATSISVVGAFGILVLTGVIVANIVRFSWWMYHTLRSYWRIFRPPYEEEDFVFMTEEGHEVRYSPEHSAIRLPLGITLLSTVVWTGST